MKVMITFSSDKFDVTQEPPNRYNPIPGHSFLAWLGPWLARGGYQVEGPGNEDWGWYLEVRGPSGKYVVGSSATPDRGKVVDWIVQVWRSRSLRERLRGAGRIGTGDPLVLLIERLVREEAGATDIGVEDLAR
jgi:hypothetical protein